MRKLALPVVAVVLATSVLASCGFINQFLGIGTTNTNGSGTITISGTISVASGVTAPSGTNIIVGLLEYVPSFDSTTQLVTPTWSTKATGNPETKPYGSSVAYSFSGVPVGQYLVVAWADTTANGSWDVGEPAQTFPAGSGSSAAALYNFQSDFTAANITLMASSGGGGSSTVTISGTVTLGQGVTLPVGGTLYVGIFDQVPSQSSATPATWSTAVQANPQHYPETSSVAYSISGVPKGNHLVIAFVDTNTNSSFDAGEISGAYPAPVGGAGLALKDFESDDAAANIALTNTALILLSSSPASGAAAVDESAGISVTFNSPVTSASISDSTVYLDYSFTTPNPVATTTSAHIPGTATLSTDGKTMTFAPNGGTLAQNLTYTLHLTTGLTDTNSNSLQANAAIPFTTRARVLGPAEVAALYNQSFEHGLASWSPDLQYAGTHVGSMTVSWANKDGTTSAAVLGRTGALSAGDWGAVFLGQDLGSNLSVAEPGGGTYVTVTVTIWRASTDNDVMNIPQAKILYGDQSSTPYASSQILSFSSVTAGTDPGWVTATTDQIRLPHTSGVLYVGKVEIGQTGTNFTTYVDSVSVNATAVPW